MNGYIGNPQQGPSRAAGARYQADATRAQVIGRHALWRFGQSILPQAPKIQPQQYMPDTQTDRKEDMLLDPEAARRWQIHNRKEIDALLRKMFEQQSQFVAFIDGGPLSFTTMVADDDPSVNLLLGAPVNPDLLPSVQRATHLVCSGLVDEIRVQFVVQSPKLVRIGIFDALRCELPETVVRLQRRESFRLRVSPSNQVSCILMPTPPSTRSPISPRVLDISTGGVGVMLNDETVFRPNQMIEAVISAPEPGAHDVPVRLRHVYSMPNFDGFKHTRAGFELQEPPQSLLLAIQRFIMRVQIQRRML